MSTRTQQPRGLRLSPCLSERVQRGVASSRSWRQSFFKPEEFLERSLEVVRFLHKEFPAADKKKGGGHHQRRFPPPSSKKARQGRFSGQPVPGGTARLPGLC